MGLALAGMVEDEERVLGGHGAIIAQMGRLF